jgi:hypothetical protein
LLPESAERIIIALDLVPHKVTVDHSDIGSAFAVIQAKLVNHKRVVPGMLTP